MMTRAATIQRVMRRALPGLGTSYGHPFSGALGTTFAALIAALCTLFAAPNAAFAQAQTGLEQASSRFHDRASFFYCAWEYYLNSTYFLFKLFFFELGGK
jgi:hypothetical protein